MRSSNSSIDTFVLRESLLGQLLSILGADLLGVVYIKLDDNKVRDVRYMVGIAE